MVLQEVDDFGVVALAAVYHIVKFIGGKIVVMVFVGLRLGGKGGAISFTHLVLLSQSFIASSLCRSAYVVVQRLANGRNHIKRRD